MSQVIKRLGFLLVLVCGCLLTQDLFAIPADFRGYVETRSVWRDTNGFQNGFMDDVDTVQWIQEFQMDVEYKPSYALGIPDVRFEKAFFRGRLAYDSIFALTDRYNDIREKSPADFEYGKDDLRFEYDLREAFLDFVADYASGAGRANVRLGRQIVQWGEADGFNLMNIVNPSDQRNKAFFSNPEDLLTPLWMARFDVKTPQVGPFTEFNFQALVIPDVRPTLYAPLDGKYNAPYAFFFKGFAPLPVKEDVPNADWDTLEYGFRVGTDIAGWALFGYYFRGYQDAAAIDFSTAATEGVFTFRHPRQETYGYSFNKWVPFGNWVFRGEGSVTKNATQVDFEDPRGRGYTKHDYYQMLFGFDKSFSNPPIGTDSALTTSVQIWYTHIADWDENKAFGRTAPEDYLRFTLLLATDYYHGQIAPSIFIAYDTEDGWLTNTAVNWSPDGKFYINLSQISFFGSDIGQSPFAPLISTASEVALKIGYRW